MMKAIYITRSDLSYWGMSHTFVQAPLAVAERYEMTLCIPAGYQVPDELLGKCERIVRFDSVVDLLSGLYPSLALDAKVHVFTGFDFPCMRVATKFKKWHGCPWTVFCWDPPSLAHRDGSVLLRKGIDFLFRHYVRQCDRMVLSIHPGLLDEVGIANDPGKVVCVPNGCDVAKLAAVPEQEKQYDIGLLSAVTSQKGRDLVDAVVKEMGISCNWITGMPQNEAWMELKRCRVAVLPYLPTHALKWNYPIKLFEFLALGMPIVAADNPGIADIIANGENGLLFKSGDADDLRRALTQILESDALRTSLAANARKSAARYDWQDIRKKMWIERAI